MSRNRRRKSGLKRNAPCHCGSGRKFKHCCEDPKRPNIDTAYREAFHTLPTSFHTYILDTNVWGSIAADDSLQDAFIAHVENNNFLAGLTIYNLFELTRAVHLLERLDALFLKARHHIWLASLYNELQELEFANYPNPPQIQWMTFSRLTDEIQPALISKFAEDETFQSIRDDHLKFGWSSFMSLEEFKKNYPPDTSGKYSINQALDFGFHNAMDFLRRTAPSFLKRLRNDKVSFDPQFLPSIQIRSLFAFYKYYIFDQVPGKSDFMDFATISFIPYVDTFVTERNALNALSHIKSNGIGLPNTTIMHINDYLDLLKSGNNSG